MVNYLFGGDGFKSFGGCERSSGLPPATGMKGKRVKFEFVDEYDTKKKLLKAK